MAKKICAHCNKKINGINTIGYDISSMTICDNCYNKLGLKMNKKYNSQQELQEDKERILNQAQALSMNDDIIIAIQQYFQSKSIHPQKLSAIPDDFIMTTGSLLQGYTIESYLGVVTGTIVVGAGMFSSWNATLADWSASEADTYTNKLYQAEEAAQLRAISKALVLGANAMIGIDIEHTTLFQDLMGVMVKGTAVKVKKI